MKSGFWTAIRRITTSPLVNVLVGLIFLGSGLAETLRTVGEGFALGAHHGAVLFGGLHALKSLPDLFEGLQHIDPPTSGES